MVFSKFDIIYSVVLLGVAFVAIRASNKTMDRWEEDMKKQVKIINENGKLAQARYGGETK